jgi:hypothetical protein
MAKELTIKEARLVLANNDLTHIKLRKNGTGLVFVDIDMYDPSRELVIESVKKVFTKVSSDSFSISIHQI